MANIEQLREQRQAEITRKLIDGQKKRAFGAFRKVNELYGQVSTETHAAEIINDGYLLVTLKPTPEEMASAPAPLHAVFRKLGVLATDQVQASIGIFEPDQYSHDYEWQVKPVPVTREKVGLFVQWEMTIVQWR